MKYFLVIVCFVLFACSGCLKNDMGCKNQTPENEDAQMRAFATANAMNVTKHSTGLYYEILNAGTGVSPVLSSRLFVTYTGKLMDGTVFETTTTPVDFYLSGVIEGWQIGLPLIKKGGKIRLIIPSTYAYGCNPQGKIPGNSVLFFEINLIDVQ